MATWKMTGRALGVVALAASTAATSCGGERGSVAGDSAAQAPRATTSQSIATTAATATDSVPTSDSTGFVRGYVKVRSELGSGVMPYADLQSGEWRVLGDIMVALPPPDAYPWLPVGQTFVFVRKTNTGWDAGFLNSGTFTIRPMLVSAAATRPALWSDAKVWTILATNQMYLCYTCDKKACCPQAAY